MLKEINKSLSCDDTWLDRSRKLLEGLIFVNRIQREKISNG